MEPASKAKEVVQREMSTTRMAEDLRRIIFSDERRTVRQRWRQQPVIKEGQGYLPEANQREDADKRLQRTLKECEGKSFRAYAGTRGRREGGREKEERIKKVLYMTWARGS